MTEGVDLPLEASSTEPPPLEESSTEPPPLGLQPTPGPAAIRRMLLFIATAGLVVGGAALRHGMLLRGRIDPDLVTTPDAALMDAIATGARIVLVVLLARVALRVRPWLRGVRANLATLWQHGAVGTQITGRDGVVRRHPDPGSAWLLVAPVPLPDDGRRWAAAVGRRPGRRLTHSPG